jgi:hypothetical protein
MTLSRWKFKGHQVHSKSKQIIERQLLFFCIFSRSERRRRHPFEDPLGFFLIHISLLLMTSTFLLNIDNCPQNPSHAYYFVEKVEVVMKEQRKDFSIINWLDSQQRVVKSCRFLTLSPSSLLLLPVDFFSKPTEIQHFKGRNIRFASLVLLLQGSYESYEIEHNSIALIFNHDLLKRTFSLFFSMSPKNIEQYLFP